MTFASLSVSARGPGPASGEEMLACLRQVIAAADDLTRRFRARIPGMDAHPLTPFALHEIALAGRRGLPQVEVARLLAMSPSSATRLIDSLEAHGVVRRDPHPNDRRVNQIVLTPAGRCLVDDLLADLARRGDEDGDPLDRAALDRFRAQLSRLCTVAA